ALVLDRQALSDAEQSAKLVAESERLGKALLNSISHELRTPIAAINSAAAGLHDLGSGHDPALRQALTSEILEASQRLNRLVRNLLDVTRLESGHLKPRLEWCDVADLIQVSLKRTGKELAQHRVRTVFAEKIPLVKMDFVLLEQVLN